LLSIMGRERPCRRAFNWYLEIAPPPPWAEQGA